MSAFDVVLDPVEVAISRTELALNANAGAIQIESVDWGDAAIQSYLGDLKYGSQKIDYRIPNRQIVITMIVGGDGNQETFNLARKQLAQKVGLLQRKYGWLKRQAGLYADVVNATLHMPDTLGETGAVEPNAVLTLETLPDFYGDEVAVRLSILSDPDSYLLTQQPDGSPILGDYPGRVRLIGIGDSLHDQHHLIWGFRSEHYDPSLTSRLSLDTSDLTPLNGAVIVNDAAAYGGDTVQIATPAGTWVSMLSTLMTQNIFGFINGFFTGVADVATVGSVAWTNITDCVNNIPDSTQVSLGSGAISHYLEITSLGFSPFSATTQILGVEFEINGKSNNGLIQDAHIQLIKGGAIVGTDKAANTWAGGSESFNIYGGPSDLWGTTITPTEFVASNFGLAISMKAVGGADIAFISSIDVKVYYVDTADPQNLTHKGSYRVFARAESTNATPQVRLLWSAGTASFNVNDAAVIPFINGKVLLDLGDIRIDSQPLGDPEWTGIIQTQANADNDITQLDELILVPVDEGGGQLTVVPAAPQSLIAPRSALVSGFTDSAAVGTVAWDLSGPAIKFNSPAHSHYLKGVGFGFNVPTGATIKGIQVDVNRRATYPTSGVILDDHVQLMKAGVVQATDRSGAVSWPHSSTVATFGSSSDLWGTTWSAADVNNANFGVVFAANGISAGGITGVVVSVSVTVYYTLGNDFVVAQDAVMYRDQGTFTQSLELRTDGAWRTDSTGTKWQPFSGEVQGDLPRIPCSGLEGLPVQLFWRASASDMATIADTLDGSPVTVIYRPCYLSRS